MYIRSQDQTILMECNLFSIGKEGNLFTIMTLSNNISIPIGKYTTKEEALGVLDIIETLLNKGISIVFHMPEDSEVEK